MNTLIEDTADKLGLTDQRIFYIVAQKKLTHVKDKHDRMCLAFIVAKRTYSKWLADRTINADVANWCLDQWKVKNGKQHAPSAR